MIDDDTRRELDEYLKRTCKKKGGGVRGRAKVAANVTTGSTDASGLRTEVPLMHARPFILVI